MLNKYPKITLLTYCPEKLVIHSSNFCSGSSQNLNLKLIRIPVGYSPFLLLVNNFGSIWAMFDVLFSVQLFNLQRKAKQGSKSSHLLPTRGLLKIDFFSVVSAFVEKLNKIS